MQPDRLGDDAAPPRVERAHDVAVGLGGRGRREQERVLESARPVNVTDRVGSHGHSDVSVAGGNADYTAPVSAPKPLHGLLAADARANRDYASRASARQASAGSMSMGRVVRGGLIQVKADVSLEGTTDDIKQRMIDKHLPLIDEAARRGVQLLCLQELFNGPYFCAEQQPRWYQMVERIPDGPTIQTDAGGREEARHGDRRADLRGGDHRRLLQRRRGDRRRRQVPRQVPQAPHPARRPGLLGEVLFPSRQSRISGVRDRRREESASTSATTATFPKGRASSG